MRIVIANHSNHSQQTGPHRRDLWIVAPRERGGSFEDRHEISYHIEIDNSYPRIDGKSYSRLTRVAYVAGERRVILTDAEFKEDIEATQSHEIKVPAGMSYEQAMADYMASDSDVSESGVRCLTEDEAADLIAKHGRYSESEARIDGLQVTVFAALERAWEAINQFADFAITL